MVPFLTESHPGPFYITCTVHYCIFSLPLCACVCHLNKNSPHALTTPAGESESPLGIAGLQALRSRCENLNVTTSLCEKVQATTA